MLKKDDLRAAHRIIPLFFDALLDTTRWEIALRELNHLFQGYGTQIVMARMSDAFIFGSFQYGFTAEMVASFLEFDDHLTGDPRLRALLAYPNRPLHCRMYVKEEELHASPIYRQVLQPASLEYTLGAPIMFEKLDFIFSLAILRRKDQPPFCDIDIERMQIFMPHFRRVAEVCHRLNECEARTSELKAALDKFYTGVIILDRNCGIEFANLAARRILDEGDGLRSSGDRLCLIKPGENAELSRSVYRTVMATMSGGNACAGHLQVTRSSGKEPLFLSVHPLTREVSWLQDWHSGTSLAVVYIADITERADTEPERLQRLFGLTEAEAEILIRLSQGENAAGIARNTDRSVVTIRNHLANIMGKTDTHSQHELVRLALASDPGTHT